MITGHWLLIQIRVEQGRQLGPHHRITSRHDNTYIKLAKGGNQCAEFGFSLVNESTTCSFGTLRPIPLLEMPP